MSNNQDFGNKLKELEAITAWFESEEVDLNEALTKFERGMQLAGELKKELEDVENRVEKIKAKFEAPPAQDATPETPDQPDEPSLF